MSPYLDWAFKGLITILFVINWFWVKRLIARQDEREKGWETAGGLVTREQYYSWCASQQAKCPINALQTWRNGMFDKGGALTRMDHTAMCKEVTKEVMDHFCNRMDELFVHHREWVGQEFKLIRAEISNVKKS